MRFFHGTSTTRLTAILEEGLLPQASHDNPERACIYLAGDPERTCIYLAGDPATAELYADLACMRRGGTPVVVEIDDLTMPSSAFSPDDYELQNHIDDLHDEDRESEIGLLSGEPVDERLRPYRRWQEVTAELCFAVTKQVAFTAPIPRHSIRNLDALAEIEAATRNAASPIISVRGYPEKRPASGVGSFLSLRLVPVPAETLVQVFAVVEVVFDVLHDAAEFGSGVGTADFAVLLFGAGLVVPSVGNIGLPVFGVSVGMFAPAITGPAGASFFAPPTVSGLGAVCSAHLSLRRLLPNGTRSHSRWPSRCPLLPSVGLAPSMNSAPPEVNDLIRQIQDADVRFLDHVREPSAG